MIHFGIICDTAMCVPLALSVCTLKRLLFVFLTRTSSGTGISSSITDKDRTVHPSTLLLLVISFQGRSAFFRHCIWVYSFHLFECTLLYLWKSSLTKLQIVRSMSLLRLISSPKLDDLCFSLLSGSATHLYNGRHFPGGETCMTRILFKMLR